MKLNYINKIKANISIYSSKRTTNILDGTYKSIYKGKSLNFENLREYVINDDIKDIDWKSSARSGTILVKQFIALKKHNIMIILDTGVKMDGDSSFQENKKDIALFTAGTIGYLAIKNNDYVGMLYQNKYHIEFKPFKYNLYNLEQYLCDYDNIAKEKEIDINELLNYAHKNIKKRMIIFVITDISGIDQVKTSVLKKIVNKHDLLFINISDNYMTGNEVYDVKEKEYIPNFLLNDKKIYELEQKIKEDLMKKNITKLKKHNIVVKTINSKKEINYKIIELLEEKKYANTN